jgi:hypothetical protein
LVGVTVGDPVGLDVGRTVGADEGVDVGLDVGVAVCAVEGVGSPVGFAESDLVGLDVDLLEGDSVEGENDGPDAGAADCDEVELASGLLLAIGFKDGALLMVVNAIGCVVCGFCGTAVGEPSVWFGELG